MRYVLAIFKLCLYALPNLMSFFSCLTFVTVGSGDYKMRGLAGLGLSKVTYAKQQNTKYKDYCFQWFTRKTILILCLCILTNLMSLLFCPTY